VCPVHQTAEIIPLVHAPDDYTIAHAKRHALGEIDIVRNEQSTTIADIDDESLVPRTVIIVGQQSSHESSDFDPATVVTLPVGFAHAAILACGNRHHRNFDATVRLTTCCGAVV